MQKEKLINKVHNLVIDEELSGQRLDNFLFNKLKNVPKSRIYRMLRGGEVRVNKKRAAPSYKIQSDDLIRIPPFWAEETLSKGKPGSNLIKLLLDAIIFEDNRILVINKPSGIASHGGSGINFGVIETLRAARPDLKNLELVHRLDRDTSGCLILAKKRSALRELHKLIFDGAILKKYVLLVRGQWQGGERAVDASLLKNQLKSGERMVTIDHQGKDSLTIFRPLKVGIVASLIEAELKTGRTHQIRVHALHIGYPIAGDEKYGDSEFNAKMKELGLKRMFLHAEKISFCWATKEKVEFVAKLDKELEEFLKVLK
ncbi:MAG TPA: 23S rRNA pseudouridine(955/2504/2580) synthase [Coxiellaceae bacterium]|nr:MAG: 23S rRNA pseudouridine(955/2504/2580) synthase [Gammaproteobacteria bacterium RBG_16_37_9]HBS51715.1 23S rRNA pseudouridine(955/2504/2580) synthase [Coxiellaceae bacterium]